jgi:penicillin-binding protein A
MTRQIRLLGAGMLCCFLVLFVQLNRLTVLQADQLNDHPLNTRQILRDFNQPRGSVTTADGVVVAMSEPTEGRFEYQRVYPEDELYAHISGFYSFTLGSSGVERTYNDELAGRTLDIQLQDITDLFVVRDRVGNLTLTIRDDAQRRAREELGDRRGSVVALDPRTGDVLAMWSYPSYDPNALADHDTATASEVASLLDANPERPRRSRAYRERLFPGSTFKLVTASAGLASGQVTPAEPAYPVETGFVPPTATNPIRNFGGSSCGGNLLEILRQSCNAAFARMAVDVGPEQMIDSSEAFGFNQAVPLDLTDPEQSVFPTDFERDIPKLAMTGIGQNEVQATPLQMAMVAAAIAGDGHVMVPHVLAEVRDTDGDLIERFEPRRWRRATDPGAAAVLREAMQLTAEEGTARNLLIDGMVVGGKTGTAQVGVDPPRSHAWIVGYAGPPDEPAHVAVAVVVEGQEGLSEQTGGEVAAPIARAVMETVLQGDR